MSFRQARMVKSGAAPINLQHETKDARSNGVPLAFPIPRNQMQDFYKHLFEGKETD